MPGRRTGFVGIHLISSVTVVTTDPQTALQLAYFWVCLSKEIQASRLRVKLLTATQGRERSEPMKRLFHEKLKAADSSQQVVTLIEMFL